MNARFLDSEMSTCFFCYWAEKNSLVKWTVWIGDATYKDSY